MSERLPNIHETKEREPLGQNVEIRAGFLRHGPADKKSGHLTEEGIDIAKKYGERFQPASDDEKYILKTYSSEMDRANETANTIIDAVNTNRKGHAKIRLELGEKAEDARMPIDALNLPYAEYVKVNRKEEKVNDRIISLHGVAQRIASQVEHFIKMSKRFKSDSRVDLINVTHIPWMPAFLKEIIGQEIEKEVDPEKKKELENDAINFGYLEGFELVIKRDGDDVGLLLKIKNKEFSISESDVRKILVE